MMATAGFSGRPDIKVVGKPVNPYLVSVLLTWGHSDITVKPVLSGHSKIDKTKVLKTDGSLMQVESIAECSLGASCNTLDLH